MLAASLPSSRTADAGATLAAVGDPEATRTVYVTVVILVALGVAMAVLAVWVFRRTRPEPELLAPLEAMESRTWKRVDPATQRRLLDEARPAGAAPLKRQASVPKLDDEFAHVAPVASFDDLADGETGGDTMEHDDLAIDEASTAQTGAVVADDLSDDEFELPAHLGDPTREQSAEPGAAELEALEIDDAVAAGPGSGTPNVRAGHDDFDDLEFEPIDDQQARSEGFADDFAQAFGDDPLLARRRRSDGDRT